MLPRNQTRIAYRMQGRFHGWELLSHDDIQKILGGNGRRVARAVWPASARGA